MKRWRTTMRGTTSWHGEASIGRLKIGYHVHRHSGRLPDRWVFQPFLIFDCFRAANSQPKEPV